MKSFRPLTVDELDLARRQVRNNARELVAEAEMLLTNGSFARAYFIAYTASEELGKLPMLASAALKLLAGKEVDWTRLGRRVRSHAAKLDMVAELDYMHDPRVEGDKDLESLKRDLEMAPTWLNLREWCLYSDLIVIDGLDDGFKSPAEMIPRELAVAAIVLARGRVNFWTSLDEQLKKSTLTSTAEGYDELWSRIDLGKHRDDD
jgi:AbiV family abortive infection protein